MIQIAKLAGLKAAAKRQGWISRIRSEADERAMLEGCRFDIRRAQRPETFFRDFLVHSEGDWAGQPVILEPWQRDDLIYPMFGWVRHTGKRRFTKTFAEIPKKNGKSFLCSALGIYFTCADGEPGAKVFATATSKDQASIVHKEAQKMVKASQALADELEVIASRSLIRFNGMQSEFSALASQEGGVDGLNAHALIIDELHRWVGFGLYNTLEYATAARSQPMTLIITTAGDDLTSCCYREHEYALQIQNGTLWDSSYLAYIRTVKDPKCSILDEEEWYRANPNLGVSIPVEGFRAAARKAALNSVSEANFRRLRLNIWTAAGTKWMDPVEWKACEQDFDLTELDGRECYGGLDLSRTKDTTSFVLVFPMEDGSVRVLSWFWLPNDTADRQKDKISWLPWSEAGAIELVEGRVQHYETIIQKIAALSRQYDLRQVAYDPAFAEVMMQQLEEEHGIERIEFTQNIQNFGPAVDEIDRRVLERTLIHNGNPVMNWQILNTLMKTQGQLSRPVRTTRDDLYKIDGTVALCMAIRMHMEAHGDSGDMQILSL